MSAPPKTTTGFLPPIPHWTFAPRRDACAYSRIPTPFDPVNEIAFTPGWLMISSPTAEPEPITRFKTPGGNPAASKISVMRTAVAGVIEAGLNTTVLPATSAGAIFQTGIATGKFHGVTQATTPSGCFIV